MASPPLPTSSTPPPTDPAARLPISATRHASENAATDLAGERELECEVPDEEEEEEEEEAAVDEKLGASAAPKLVLEGSEDGFDRFGIPDEASLRG